MLYIGVRYNHSLTPVRTAINIEKSIVYKNNAQFYTH